MTSPFLTTITTLSR